MKMDTVGEIIMKILGLEIAVLVFSYFVARDMWHNLLEHKLFRLDTLTLVSGPSCLQRSLFLSW